MNINTIFGSPDAQDFENTRQKYPYFSGTDIMMLESDVPLSASERTRIAARIAASTGDERALRRLLGESDIDFDTFYPDLCEQTPSTDDTIETFLNAYGRPADRQTEILEKTMFSGMPDFGAAFVKEHSGDSVVSDNADDETSRRINSFLANGGAEAVQPSAESISSSEEVPVHRTAMRRKPEMQDVSRNVAPGDLTESLARVMIKNGNYDKALEIITSLYLANPSKSAYFADQIRFLKKLILNRKYKKD